MSHFWIFGYGSLMWRPGFAYTGQAQAVLHGAHRRLCVYSHVHRGTPERPGLVLGLDRGGSCRGIAFQVASDKSGETLRYLRAREQVTMIYHEVVRKVRLADGSEVKAVTYVVDRRHPQYAGVLDLKTQLGHIRNAKGRSGLNLEYVLNTHNHLAELGVEDPLLRQLALELLERQGA